MVSIVGNMVGLGDIAVEVAGYKEGEKRIISMGT